MNKNGKSICLAPSAVNFVRTESAMKRSTSNAEANVDFAREEAVVEV